MREYMPTDMQYKDGLRKDKFLNDLVIEAIRNGNTEKALEYLEKDKERIVKALEEQYGNELQKKETILKNTKEKIIVSGRNADILYK